jgi:hypothetical protein
MYLNYMLHENTNRYQILSDISALVQVETLNIFYSCRLSEEGLMSCLVQILEFIWSLLRTPVQSTQSTLQLAELRSYS